MGLPTPTPEPLTARGIDIGYTGGKHLNRTDPATWRALENLEKVPVARVETVDLWNRLVLLILLAVLMGADWLLRLLREFA